MPGDVAGAPLLKQVLSTHLKQLVDEKSDIIRGWVQAGQLAPIEPLHLLFILWSTTQHYADFGVQIEALSGQTLNDEVFFEQAVFNLQHIITQGSGRGNSLFADKKCPVGVTAGHFYGRYSASSLALRFILRNQ